MQIFISLSNVNPFTIRFLFPSLLHESMLFEYIHADYKSSYYLNIVESCVEVPMSVRPSRGHRIRDAFFTQKEGNPQEWVCKCGAKRKQQGSGYTNLVSHVEKQHANDLHNLLSDTTFNETPSSASESLFLNSKTVQIHGWMDLVVHGLLPFSITENQVFARNVRYKSISRKTLSKYMHDLTQRVEAKISAKLPKKFAIVFDGWSANQTHFVGMFATYPNQFECGYEKTLLGISPFENEDSQSADAHIEYITYVLELFNRSLENVVAYIGDNCNVNLSMAT